MIGRLIVTLLLLCPFTLKAESAISEGFRALFRPGHAPNNHTIKVLIAHDEPGVMLEAKGRYKIFDPNTGKLVSSRLVGKRKFIQPTPEGLRWEEDFTGLHQLQFVPENPQGTLIVEGVEYRGNIYVYDVNGSVCVVNEVDIEDYVTSVLALQFKEPMTHEALAAIVIATRTNALYQAGCPKTKFWAVDAKEEGYTGYVVTAYADKIKHVVRLTNNMVMSQTAAYEGVVTPFPAFLAQNHKQERTVLSKLSLEEFQSLAAKGEDAAQILSRAFPETSIQLVP